MNEKKTLVKFKHPSGRIVFIAAQDVVAVVGNEDNASTSIFCGGISQIEVVESQNEVLKALIDSKHFYLAHS